MTGSLRFELWRDKRSGQPTPIDVPTGKIEAVQLPESINDLPCVNKPTLTGYSLELYFASADSCQRRHANIYVSKRSARGERWGEPQLVEPVAWLPGISLNALQLFFHGGDRIGTDLPVGTFGNGLSAFVRKRSSRDEEFCPAIELGEAPNTASAFFAVWNPDVTDHKSDRSGVPKELKAWQATFRHVAHFRPHLRKLKSSVKIQTAFVASYYNDKLSVESRIRRP